MRTLEFGRPCSNVIDPTDPDECYRALDRVLDNFTKTKARAFPEWPGTMELVIEKCSLCRQHLIYGWRADVPEEFCDPKYRRVT